MKVRINFQLVGATLCFVAMTMTSAVYACAVGDRTNQTQMRVEICDTEMGCGIYNDRVHAQVSDDCSTWCCPDGHAYYSPSCVFVNETGFLGAPVCCEGTDAGRVVTTKSCDPL